MIINSARFTVSNTNYAKCPSDRRHEYAHKYAYGAQQAGQDLCHAG